jgi:hypothetical protein
LHNYFWKKISIIAGFALIPLLVLSFTVQAAEQKDQEAKSPLLIGVISFQALIPDEGLGNIKRIRKNS